MLCFVISNLTLSGPIEYQWIRNGTGHGCHGTQAAIFV